MLLSINTCGSPGSVALGRIDRDSAAVAILAQAEFAARTYSAQLIPRIGEMLAAHQATIRDVEAIVVVRGPGSFTGIRVGLSAAKGLAEASDAGLIALSQLALVASGSGRKHVLAAIDAGRGEYYVGEYLDGRAVRETILAGPALCAAAQGGSAGVLVCEAPAGVLCDAVRVPAPDAADALRFAAARFRASRFDDIESLDANYLRRSDAEIFGPQDGAKGKRQAGPRSE